MKSTARNYISYLKKNKIEDATFRYANDTYLLTFISADKKILKDDAVETIKRNVSPELWSLLIFKKELLDLDRLHKLIQEGKIRDSIKKDIFRVESEDVLKIESVPYAGVAPEVSVG